jgi:hypothetical protein
VGVLDASEALMGGSREDGPHRDTEKSPREAINAKVYVNAMLERVSLIELEILVVPRCVGAILRSVK